MLYTWRPCGVWKLHIVTYGLVPPLHPPLPTPQSLELGNEAKQNSEQPNLLFFSIAEKLFGYFSLFGHLNTNLEWGQEIREKVRKVNYNNGAMVFN